MKHIRFNENDKWRRAHTTIYNKYYMFVFINIYLISSFLCFVSNAICNFLDKGSYIVHNNIYIYFFVIRFIFLIPRFLHVLRFKNRKLLN